MPKVSAIPQLVSAQWKTAGIMLCLMSGVRSFVGVIMHGPPSFASFRKETVTTICGVLLYSTILLNHRNLKSKTGHRFREIPSKLRREFVKIRLLSPGNNHSSF